MQKNILLLDDDSHTRESVKKTLESAGYHVAFILPGKCGTPIEMLDKTVGLCNTKDVPDLIIIELCAADQKVWGVENQFSERGFLELIKGDPTVKNVPVVVLTSLKETDYRDKCFKAGCSAFMVKPFDPQRLLVKINSILESTEVDKEYLDMLISEES